MNFPSGVQAICSASYNGHSSQALPSGWTRSWLEMVPAFPYKNLRLRQGIKDPNDDEAELIQEHVVSEKNQFGIEMDHMAQCLIENRQPYTPGEEGLQDQKLMEAIYQSAQSGSVVKFNPPKELDTTRGPAPTKLT